MTVVRVVPDVLGIDKHFDYTVPDGSVDVVHIGDLVRVELNGRRVRAWVVDVDPADAHTRSIKPIVRWSGRGPDADIVALAEWAAVRWAGRRRNFLGVASPPRHVATVPRERRTGLVVEPRSPASTAILANGGGVLRLPPTSDPVPAVLSAVALGPTLVVEAGIDRAMLLAARLRRSGLTVALVPDQWDLAAGGVDVVVGARTAAWAPCPGLRAVVVLDEHDEALQEEGSPTWHARDVVLERGRRAGAPVLLVSPCPTLAAVERGPTTRPPRERERRAWPIVEIVDRRDEEPWKRSLLTSALIAQLRDHDRRVVCVLNVVGRARRAACRQCRALARCERCEAAVSQAADHSLVCPGCRTSRPPVCGACGAGRFVAVRPGVTRLREELEAAAARPVVEVTGAGPDHPAAVGVYVGTEAVLHRVDRADTVAFLDLDAEILAPRYRAAEQAMGLLARAARLVGPRERGGRILVQTFVPDHEVIRAAVLADPGRLTDAERSRRQALRLPPFGAFAEISGSGSDEFVASLEQRPGVTVVGAADDYVARADDWTDLGEVLSSGNRPAGSRLRIAVDPPR